MTKDIDHITVGSADVYLDDQFVGYTEDEVKITCNREILEYFSGLPLIAVTKVVKQVGLSVSFVFSQIQSQNVAYALGLTIDEITVPGNDIIKIGRSSSLGSQFKVDVVHDFPDGRELRIVLWKSRPTGAIELTFSSGNWVGLPSTWNAEEDTTHSGEELGRIQIEKEVKS